MLRRAPRATCHVLLAASFALVTVACGSREEQVLKDFFRASRLRDNATLANFATTSFDPRRQGQVQSFEVVNVSDERETPLPLKQMAAKYEQARSADAEFTQRKREYQNTNSEAIARISGNGKPRRADADVQAAWEQWRQETMQHTKAVSDSLYALNSGRAIAEVSLAKQNEIKNVVEHDGTLVTKDVTIDAEVRTPEGSVENRRMVVTLQRVILEKDGDDVEGRWVVTSVQPAGEGQPQRADQ